MKASPFNFKKAILLETKDYILINKPPYISTLEDRNDPTNLLRLAREYDPQAQACHRLDKETSGVLAFARHQDAYRHLSIQFENRQVSKTYHAIIDGLHRFENTEVNQPIEKQNDGTVRLSRAGKSAQTSFTTLKLYKAHTLVECKPVTGRMHQIRVHLKYLNVPITGDEMYGGKPFYLSSVKRGYNLKKSTAEEPLLKRVALHAFRLVFLDQSEKEIDVLAPYPKDFGALIKQLEQNMR